MLGQMSYCSVVERYHSPPWPVLHSLGHLGHCYGFGKGKNEVFPLPCDPSATTTYQAFSRENKIEANEQPV